MERVMGIEHQGGRSRDEQTRSEQLRHRRAAGERCERSGVLRRCTPVVPGGSAAALGLNVQERVDAPPRPHRPGRRVDVAAVRPQLRSGAAPPPDEGELDGGGAADAARYAARGR